MTARIRDYSPLLREAIAEAKAAGLGTAARELEQACTGVFTTSSEMLQEHGLAITRFLRATRGTLPASAEAKLVACVTETELAGTGWRALMARLRRARVWRVSRAAKH
jgi:hypothetical protein